MTAHPEKTGFKRDPRTGRGFGENHGQGPAFKRGIDLTPFELLFDFLGQLQGFPDFSRRKIRYMQEISFHTASSISLFILFFPRPFTIRWARENQSSLNTKELNFAQNGQNFLTHRAVQEIFFKTRLILDITLLKPLSLLPRYQAQAI
jgi:hypothetical protein